MSRHEIETALGYTPCVCGVIDGTWHRKCYQNKTKEQIAAGYEKAFAAARRYLRRKASASAIAIITKTNKAKP